MGRRHDARDTPPPQHRRRSATALTVALGLLLAGATPGAASAQADPAPAVSAEAPPTAFAPDISPGQLGWLRLRVAGPSGATIAVQETLSDGRTLEIARFTLDGTAGGRARLTAWRCDLRARHFTVSATSPDGTAQVVPIAVTTPSCRGRVELRVATRRPAAGRPLTVVARDRWRTGALALRLCVQGPADAAGRCRRADLSTAVPSRSLSMDAGQSGRYRLVLRGPQDVLLQRSILVGPRAGRLRLLATGDSEIQILDVQLADRLRARGVRVTSDAHVGSGLAKLFQLNWLQHAATSARSVRPDITVVFLGANDGYGIGANACCDANWSAAYALRAAQMMRSYTRRGAGRVFWFLLPAPRPEGYRTIFSGVNRALRLAAGRVRGVRLVDLGPTITPGGRFQQTVRYRGQTVSVRQPDGIHLSVAGYRIAVDVLVAAMRADGAL